MARQVVVEVIGDASKFSRATSTAVGNAGKLDTGLRRTAIGGAIAGAAMSVVTKAIDFVGSSITNSITAASDLSETVNKVGVVFGSAAKPVLDWGKTAATALGMSSNQALAAAGTYGNLLVSLGLTGEKAADMSMEMVNLAADMASFNNASPADTLAAIQSGLVGEMEPLRKFGISLSDATLREKAMSMGLVTTTKTVLPASIKAQASYALILEQSGSAQGDFARTADGLANKQRIANAEMENAQAVMGARLLPVMLAVMGVVTQYLIPAFSAIADIVGGVVGPAIQFISERMDIFGPIALGLGIAVGATLVPAFIAWAAAAIAAAIPMVVLAAPVIAVGLAIGAVVLLAIELAKVLGITLPDAVTKATDQIGQLAEIPGEIAGNIASAKGVVAAGANTGITVPIVNATQFAHQQSVKIAAKTPHEVADGLRDGIFDVKGAMTDLKDAMANTLSPVKEMAAIEGFLTGKFLAKGLNDKRPSVAAEFRAYKIDAELRLNELKRNAAIAGQDTGKGFGSGIGGQAAHVGRRTAEVVSRARDKFKMADDARVWGKNTGTAFMEGIAKGVMQGTGGVMISLTKIQGILEAHSPPGPESPLHNIDRWGEATGEAFTTPLAKAISGGMTHVRNALTFGSLPLPAMALAGMAGSAAGGIGGSGVTVVFNGPVYGDDLEDLANRIAFRLRTVG